MALDGYIYLYRVIGMERLRKPSPQTVEVLLALAKDPTEWRYGYDLCQELDLKAGTLYPILMRLADRGLLETKWETEAPQGRPARHLYRLTGAGRELAAALKRAVGTPRRTGFRPQPEGA
jgi:DNA-binding PadR family transcriptional regulator